MPVLECLFAFAVTIHMLADPAFMEAIAGLNSPRHRVSQTDHSSNSGCVCAVLSWGG